MAMRDFVSILAMLTGVWREARVAILAFKGLLACMGPPMSIQAGLERESPVTLVATVWLFSSVDPPM